MQWPYIKHPAQSTSYTDTPSNLLSLYVTKHFEIWVPRKFGLKFQQWQVCSNVGHVSIWIIVIPTLTFWHLRLSGTFQNLRPCHFSILHGLSYTHFFSLINVESTLTDFEKFHPPQNKNPPSTFIEFLDFSTLHVYSNLHVLLRWYIFWGNHVYFSVFEW